MRRPIRWLTVAAFAVLLSSLSGPAAVANEGAERRDEYAAL